jgi:predicted Fe-Mo cluster-binding NifX family protein
MIYAIPNDGLHVANHFMKAPYIALYNEQGLVKNIPNGALGGGCKAKSQLLNQLKELRVKAVIARNIGERSLAKLLRHNICVYRVAKRVELDAVLTSDLTKLASGEQGRPSIQHRNKTSCSGCSGSKEKAASRLQSSALSVSPRRDRFNLRFAKLIGKQGE